MYSDPFLFHSLVKAVKIWIEIEQHVQFLLIFSRRDKSNIKKCQSHIVFTLSQVFLTSFPVENMSKHDQLPTDMLPMLYIWFYVCGKIDWKIILLPGFGQLSIKIKMKSLSSVLDKTPHKTCSPLMGLHLKYSRIESCNTPWYLPAIKSLFQSAFVPPQQV